MVALLFVAVGCTDSGSTTVTVAAASSLTNYLEAVADDGCCGTARVSFAGSNAVAAQVRAGAPVDVVGLADLDLLRELVADGLVESEPLAMSTNRLVLVLAPGNPAAIESVADLGRSDVTVALADPAVPAGDYARRLLEAVFVDVSPSTLEANVRAVLTRVALGEADAGIVYATDAVSGPDNVSVIDLPEVGIEVGIGVGVVVASTRRIEARSFVRSLTSDSGNLLASDFEFEPFVLSSDLARARG